MDYIITKITIVEALDEPAPDVTKALVDVRKRWRTAFDSVAPKGARFAVSASYEGGAQKIGIRGLGVTRRDACPTGQKIYNDPEALAKAKAIAKEARLKRIANLQAKLNAKHPFVRDPNTNTGACAKPGCIEGPNADVHKLTDTGERAAIEALRALDRSA